MNFEPLPNFLTSLIQARVKPKTHSAGVAYSSLDEQKFYILAKSASIRLEVFAALQTGVVFLLIIAKYLASPLTRCAHRIRRGILVFPA